MTRSRPAERRHGVHQHPTFRLLRHHRLARCGNAGWRVVESCAGRQQLVSLIDDDPARALARHEMRRRLGTLNAKKAIIDGPETWDQFDVGTPDLSRSAWLALGSLNAGRANTARMEQLRPALCTAGRYALRDGFPLLSWVIENAVRRFSGSPQSRATIRLMFDGAVRATELAEVASATASATVRRGRSSVASPTSKKHIVIKRGQRDRAEEFLGSWLERSASGHVYICDQYFGPEELDLLMLIQAAVPAVEVAVLTSKHCHKQRRIVSLSEAYRAGWHEISDQRPPTAEIVIVGLEESDKSPIHDRSILSEHSGLSLGTSCNSLGLTQESTMTVSE